MPGYELEKGFDQWWRLIPRVEEFNLTSISDDDLKSRANYVEISVNSIEHCSRWKFDEILLPIIILLTDFVHLVQLVMYSSLKSKVLLFNVLIFLMLHWKHLNLLTLSIIQLKMEETCTYWSARKILNSRMLIIQTPTLMRYLLIGKNHLNVADCHQVMELSLWYPWMQTLSNGQQHLLDISMSEKFSAQVLGHIPLQNR